MIRKAHLTNIKSLVCFPCSTNINTYEEGWHQTKGVATHEMIPSGFPISEQLPQGCSETGAQADL